MEKEVCIQAVSTKNASGEAGDTVHKLKKDKTAKLKKSQKLYPGMYLYVPIEYWS